jgi:hypothetical protein
VETTHPPQAATTKPNTSPNNAIFNIGKDLLDVILQAAAKQETAGTDRKHMQTR